MKEEIKTENIGTPVNNGMDGEAHITTPTSDSNNGNDLEALM